MINIKNFHSNLPKIDKKSYKDIDIYYIGYMIKKFGDCENINSVNPLYLIIHSTTGHFKEKNNEKYLILDSTDKYKEVSSEIRSEIKTLKGGTKSILCATLVWSLFSLVWLYVGLHFLQFLLES